MEENRQTGGAAVLGYWWAWAYWAGHLLGSSPLDLLFTGVGFYAAFQKFKNGVGNSRPSALVIVNLWMPFEAEVQAEPGRSGGKVDGCKARYGCLAIHKAFEKSRLARAGVSLNSEELTQQFFSVYCILRASASELYQVIGPGLVWEFSMVLGPIVALVALVRVWWFGRAFRYS